MKKYPFKTNGVYVRNILPEKIKGYWPFLDTNKYWKATNNKDNLSSYEILCFDCYEDSAFTKASVKASFQTKTGEILTIVDDYYKSFRFAFDVEYNEKNFEFGNSEFKIWGTPHLSCNENSPDILYVYICRPSDNAEYVVKEFYQKQQFRFIPFIN